MEGLFKHRTNAKISTDRRRSDRSAWFHR